MANNEFKFIPDIIYIDSREHKIIEYLTDKNISFKNKNLDSGDFFFPSFPEAILAERKTFSDLKSSLSNEEGGSRYHDQINRMIEARESNLTLENPINLKLIYVIEADSSRALKELGKKVLRGVISSLISKYDIYVYMSESVEDTVRFLFDCASKLKNKKIEKIKMDLETFSIIGGSKTSDKNNPERLSISYYQGIPGIGKQKAKKLFDKYGIISDFITASKAENFKEQLKELGFNEKLIDKIEVYIGKKEDN